VGGCGLEWALDLYRPLGSRASEGLALKNLGHVLWEQGDPTTAQVQIEEALAILKETGNRRGQASCLETLGMAANDLGEYDQARDHLQLGLDICRQVGLRFLEGTILTELGVAAAQAGDWSEAKAAFAQSLSLFQELGHPQHAAEVKAGLAQSHLGLGGIAKAEAYVAELLGVLEHEPDLRRAQRPYRVHLICFQVLQAAGDERAGPVLERAHRLLQARAAKITDGATRQLFLNRPAHRELEMADVLRGAA
jgi:tetratricopeptide (TPR) repeat protein